MAYICTTDLDHALREVPNVTTGTSPYMLVYGRNPRGPLTILKESWTGENNTSASLAQPVADYLLDLRSKLSDAAEFAQSHTDADQQGYAAHYNLRARQKKFQEGDQVIVLAPEDTGKMGERWLGPGTVVKVKSNLPTVILLVWAMATYALCMQIKCVVSLLKCVVSLLECKVAVLLRSVTQNLVKVLSPEVVANESVMPSVRVEPEKLKSSGRGATRQASRDALRVRCLLLGQARAL